MTEEKASLREPCTYDEARGWVAAAEQGAGWLAACEEQDVYLLLTERMLDALASHLDDIREGSVLEICAGSGGLARALSARSVEVIPTDARTSHDSVEALCAADALSRYRPGTVLGSFVPCDSGVDERVLDCPAVNHYIILNARIGGRLGSPRIWSHPDWTAERLSAVEKWMICRHDVWLGPGQELRRHGEAWHLRRQH